MQDWLKKNDLPFHDDAIDLVMKQAQFLRYHELVWLKRDEFKKEMNPERKKIYDAI